MTQQALKLDFPGIQTRFTEEEIQNLAQIIRNAKTYTMGPELKNLEIRLSEYVGVKYSVGLSSATAALELSAMVSDLREGDEVILPAHTFTASALPFLRKRCKLVFADINPDTWVMDIQDVESKITSRTRAIVAVHLYGLPVDMTPLMELVKRHKLLLVEDCAQAIGAEYHGKKVGAFGDFACLSFHSQKNITSLGEGGALLTPHEDAYERILGLRKIGSRPFKDQKKYWIPAMANIVEAVPGELPHNFALPEIGAAGASMALKRLDAIVDRRKAKFDYLTRALRKYEELKFQTVPAGSRSAYHLLPARYAPKNGKTRNDLIELLYDSFGVKCVVQYWPLYNYELFRNNGYDKKTCPRSDLFYDQMISFPWWSDMPQESLDLLVDSVSAALERLRG